MRSHVRYAVVGLVFAAPLALATVAAASNYPIHTGPLTASGTGPDSILQSGDVVTLSGGGFAPGAHVTLLMHSTPTVLGTTSASATGWVHVRVTIPADTVPGDHTLEAEGPAAAGGTNILTLEVVVAGRTAPAVSPTGLPFTGAEIATTAAIGGTAVLAGSGALMAARRRRSAR